MLKVLPKSAANWKPYKTAVVGVSLNSRNHVGPAFAGLMDWVGKNFESCIIDLSDTLHRYNLINDGHSAEEAHRLARLHGDSWLRDHTLVIGSVPIPTSVIRWDSWLSHPDFQDNFESFKNASLTQPDFRDALVQDIHHFNLRRNITPGAIAESQFQNSMDYLLEELAAHAILYTQTPCAVVYPGKDHESFKLARDGKVRNVPAGHLNSCFTRMIVYSFGSENIPAPLPQTANQNRAA